MQDSLASFATEMGLRIAVRLLEDEVAQRCGARHERRDGRDLYRHGPQAGCVTLAGQKLPVAKPGVRRADGGGEVELENYALLQRDWHAPRNLIQML